MQNGLPVLDGEAMSLVPPNDGPRLDGVFWTNFFSGGGICGEFSSCSHTYIEWTYVLSPGRRYTYSTNSSSGGATNTVIAATSYGGESSNSDSGTYRIEKNIITFSKDNGTSRA